MTSRPNEEFVDAQGGITASNDVATISLPARLPPFWRQNPRLGFAQFEAAVAASKLGDEQKFNLVVPLLGCNNLELITDLILEPPATGKYQTLKERLIATFQESDDRQLQKLLSGLQLGDQKPSHLLRRMRDLGGKLLSQEALKVMWLKQLPAYVRSVLSINTESVLLGLRSALREDSQVSPALMTYGSTLRIPSDFFEPSPPEIEDAEFVRCLNESMANLSPSNKSHSNNRNTFVYKDLATCTHVFVRNDMVKSPLTPPYDGPFEVIHRGEKQFTIQMPLRTAVVSIDRLKPAYLLNEEEITPTSSSMQNKQQASPSRFPSIVPQPAAAAKPQRDTIVTRSGRTVKPNVRFA